MNRPLRVFAAFSLLCLSAPLRVSAGGLEEKLDEDVILKGNERLAGISSQIKKYRRKASLLRQQAGIRQRKASRWRDEAQAIRDSAFGYSRHLHGIAAMEKGSATDELLRAQDRKTAAGYAGALIGDQIGGNWGALAGWFVGTTAAGTGTDNAEIHETLAARKLAEARQAEGDAIARSRPLESRAERRDSQIEKLIFRAELFESLATAKELLLNAELTSIRAEIVSKFISANWTDRELARLIPEGF